MITTIEQDVIRANQHLQQQEPPLKRIQESLEGLKIRISTELENLTTFSGRASQILRCIAQKDYDPILAFCDYAQVGPEAIQLLEALLDATKEFSKGLVIPADPPGGLGLKLSDLEKSWMTAHAIAIDIQRLNPELTQAYQAFHAVNHSSHSPVQGLRNLELSVNTTRRLWRTNVVAFTNTGRTTDDERNIAVTPGEKDVYELKVCSHGLRQVLSQDCNENLHRVELISHAIGYNRPWQPNPSDLQAVIRDSEAQAQLFEKKKRLRNRGNFSSEKCSMTSNEAKGAQVLADQQLDALRDSSRNIRLYH